MIPVGLDNIIFSLQKAGGASVVWQQHLQRLLSDEDFSCSIREFDNAELNFFRKNLIIDDKLINQESSKYLNIKRYLDLDIDNGLKHIFHSSHYRINKAKNALNITTVHDFTYEYFMIGIKQKVHSWQKYKAINNSKGVICISNSTKNDLIKFLPSFDKKKIKVIYNGVDECFKPLLNSFFVKGFLFEKFSFILYVGDRKATYKNFNTAVEVCSSVKLPLLMVGGGELTEQEKVLLKSRLGESNYQSVLGVSSEDLNWYYNNALCLLYPSLYEGFGIPVVEAQKAGCPVVAINTSSILEVIGNLYFALDDSDIKKIGDKIKELSLNANLRKETIEKGFEKSNELSWEKTYLETKNFYNEIYEK